MSRQLYEPLVRAKAATYWLDAELLCRQVTTESKWNPRAQSRSDARGLLQLMQKYYGHLGNLFDPELNVETGARLMRGYLDAFGGDYAKALAAYNGGQTAIKNWIDRFGDDWRRALKAHRDEWRAVATYGDAAKADQVARYVDLILGPEVAKVEEKPTMTQRPPCQVRLTSNKNLNDNPSRGLVFHSSRSGTRNDLAQEYRGTLDYCLTPGTTSYNVLIGPSESTLLVPLDDGAWHGTYLNASHLSVAFAQAYLGQPLTDFQYEQGALWALYLSGLKGWPLVHVTDENARGYIAHAETAQGREYGKSDPGPEVMARLDVEIAALVAAAPVPARYDPFVADLFTFFGSVRGVLVNDLGQSWAAEMDAALIAPLTSGDLVKAEQYVARLVPYLTADLPAQLQGLGSQVGEQHAKLVTKLAG